MRAKRNVSISGGSRLNDPGSGLQPRNSGLKGPHTYAQPFLKSNGTWPTSLNQPKLNPKTLNPSSVSSVSSILAPKAEQPPPAVLRVFRSPKYRENC